jgi:hypothetical protein
MNQTIPRNQMTRLSQEVDALALDLAWSQWAELKVDGTARRHDRQAIDLKSQRATRPGAVNMDAGFVQGWFEGVSDAGYAPTYYGNGTAGTEFATPWCATVAAQREIALHSYLWSFQPSLLGSFTMATAPRFAPYETGCPGRIGRVAAPDRFIDVGSALGCRPRRGAFHHAALVPG